MNQLMIRSCIAQRRERRKSLRHLLTGVSIAGALLSIWTAPAAQATAIYWRDGNVIGSANLDGTGVNQNLVATNTSGGDIAADANHVYWTNGLAIGRAERDGEGADQSFYTVTTGPAGEVTNSIAVDGSHLYWGSRLSINRTDLDGTGPNLFLFDTYGGGTELSSFAVDDTYIYYALQADVMGAMSSIGRANLDGSGRNDSFIPLGSAPFGMAVDETHLYLAFGDILRANLDGTGLAPFVAGGFDVAVYGGHVYWTNPDAGTIGRANLDGSGVDQNFITGLDAPRSIAVVPEPSTSLLVMLGLVVLAGAGRRHRSKRTAGWCSSRITSGVPAQK